ncbi:uncharacterized protein IL334_004951 [Kwoniella shivajii]|uniref:Uncharacterized protein n=1 Tax=Kwoniella shivajii TaxID=564305 RepID=A0ABZ1D5R2_9TREE|nr:hypothetical protein IL334_004951 [Kwoniella shivajii]
MASMTSHSFPRPTPSTSPFVSSIASNVPSNRLTTPLAPPPPPPLYMSAHDHMAGPERQVRYAGADHTLGPTFSEEEDGDDSAFIAAKMAALGLDPNGKPYDQNGYAQQESRPAQSRDVRSRNPLIQAQSHAQVQFQAQRQAQLQYLAAQAQMQQQQQQQQALLQLLAQQSQAQINPQLREAMAILEIQQAQQSATDRHVYAQQQAQRAYAQAQRQPGWDQTRLIHQQQQQQQQQIREMQYLQDIHLQQQLSALQMQTNEYKPQSRPNSDGGIQRSALAAQMQANLQARTGRVAEARGMALDDSEIRTRFENAADTYTPPIGNMSRFDTSPLVTNTSGSPTSPSWRSSDSGSPSPTKTTILTPTELPTPSAQTHNSIRSPKGGRFSQAMATKGEQAYGTLTSTLSGRSIHIEARPQLQSVFNVEKKEAIQISPEMEKRPLKYTIGALGNGRPSTQPANSNNNRSASLPVQEPKTTLLSQRVVSQPTIGMSKVMVVRQPYGPPCEAAELGDKNFQSRLRRQAGLNLTMLGRRVESPCPTPVLA